MLILTLISTSNINAQAGSLFINFRKQDDISEIKQRSLQLNENVMARTTLNVTKNA